MTSLPDFSSGMAFSELSAAQLDELVRRVKKSDNLRVGPGLTMFESPDGRTISLVSTRQRVPATSVRIRTFRLVDASPADWLICVELNGAGDDLGGNEVNIAKVRELQRTWQDGEVDTLERLHTFDGSLLQVVTRDDLAEKWVPVPPFQVGDQIQAKEVTYTGADDGNGLLTLLDDNVAARAWAVD